jgi:predicted nucleic acid-binding protein
MVSPLYGHRVYVDTSALIYTLEAPHLYPRLQTQFIDLFKREEWRLVTSWITFAEVLVKPLLNGDTGEEAGYRAFFVSSTNFEILHVNQGIADQAANLRASYGFKLPDAIHIATGMAAGCTRYLTGDTKWAHAGLSVIDAASL